MTAKRPNYLQPCLARSLKFKLKSERFRRSSKEKMKKSWTAIREEEEECKVAFLVKVKEGVKETRNKERLISESISQIFLSFHASIQFKLLFNRLFVKRSVTYMRLCELRAPLSWLASYSVMNSLLFERMEMNVYYLSIFVNFSMGTLTNTLETWWFNHNLYPFCLNLVNLFIIWVIVIRLSNWSIENYGMVKNYMS